MSTETTVEVQAEQDQSHDETPIFHTARELELEQENTRLRQENDQLRTTNRELFIKAGGESTAPEIDPVAATDARLVKIIEAGFSNKAIKEV